MSSADPFGGPRGFGEQQGILACHNFQWPSYQIDRHETISAPPGTTHTIAALTTPIKLTDAHIESAVESFMAEEKRTMVKFPEWSTLRSDLEKSFTLAGYFKEKGYTDRTTTILCEYFAGKTMTDVGIPMNLALALADLQTGQNGYSGRIFVAIDGLDSGVWMRLQMELSLLFKQYECK